MAVEQSAEQKEEALIYATMLYRGMLTGFVLLLLSFAAYLLGLLPAYVPPQRLTELWSQPVDIYLQQTGSPLGWGWLRLAGHGDFGNLIGIALLAGCSLPPLLALIPMFLRQRSRAYALICALEAAVLLLAASGLLTSGH